MLHLPPQTHCMHNYPTHYLHIRYLYFSPQDGWTALHLAAQEGKVDVVRLLTEAEAQLNIQTEVHTLCHVWSTDLDSHFLSVDREVNVYMYMYIQGMLRAADIECCY